MNVSDVGVDQSNIFNKVPAAEQRRYELDMLEHQSKHAEMRKIRNWRLIRLRAGVRMQAKAPAIFQVEQGRRRPEAVWTGRGATRDFDGMFARAPARGERRPVHSVHAQLRGSAWPTLRKHTENARKSMPIAGLLLTEGAGS
jgi:hypothetical protein